LKKITAIGLYRQKSAGTGFFIHFKTKLMKIFFSYLICVITLFTQVSSAQSSTQPVINSVISGVVTDDKINAPLEGALVKIKGITNQVLTDNKGQFSLKTAQRLPLILEVSFVGYKPIEIEVKGEAPSHDIQIHLQDAQTQLNEVVVVGYGTQRKTDITGSVASVPKTALKQPVSTFDNMLQGAVSGVAVTQSSGAPGSTATIRIRGGNSISFGNDPLYVIDGFIVYNNNSYVNTGASNGVGVNALSTINPTDIESIEVLKDASATAIYGSRGANGVVIITTKRGKRGGNEISYSNYFGVQKVTKKLDLLNATEWMQLVNDINESDSKPHTFSDSAINAAGEGSDWQDAALRNGPIQNHEISVSGGDEKSRYLISGNYFRQEGTVVNTDFKRYSGRINYERNLSDKFKVAANVFGSQSKEDKLFGNAYGAINFQNTSFANLVQLSPAVPIYNEDGSYNISSPYSTTPTNLLQDIAKTATLLI
jgi:TonB-linked SusC/RagA family outer membrane protein